MYAITNTFSLTIILFLNKIILVIAVGILLIIMTCLYASLDSLTQSNFTVIGNKEGYLGMFIIWTFCIATYFLYNSIQLLKKYNYTFKYQKILSTYIYLACIITPFIPYTEQNPFLDDLHVFFAFSSATLFLIVWLFFLNHIKHITKQLELPFLLLIQILGISLVYFSSINSIIELIIIIAMILLIEFLKKI